MKSKIALLLAMFSFQVTQGVVVPYELSFGQFVRKNLKSDLREAYKKYYTGFIDRQYSRSRPLRRKHYEKVRAKAMRYLELNKPMVLRQVVNKLTANHLTKVEREKIEAYLLREGLLIEFIARQKVSQGTVWSQTKLYSKQLGNNVSKWWSGTQKTKTVRTKPLSGKK